MRIDAGRSERPSVARWSVLAILAGAVWGACGGDAGSPLFDESVTSVAGGGAGGTTSAIGASGAGAQPTTGGVGGTDGRGGARAVESTDPSSIGLAGAAPLGAGGATNGEAEPTPEDEPEPATPDAGASGEPSDEDETDEDEPDEGGAGGSGAETGAGGAENEGATGGTDGEGAGGTESSSAGAAGEPGDGDPDEPDEPEGSAGTDSGPPPAPPPLVEVQVGVCEPFTPCGGELDGVWTYVNACTDPAALGVDEAEIEQLCPGIDIQLSGEVSGTLSFAGGQVTRTGQSLARGTIAVPGLCALGLGGCGGVRQELLDNGLTGATCTSGGGFFPSCNCFFSILAPELDAVPFQTTATAFTLSNGRSFDYCIEASDLTYQETNNPQEPGLRRLERQ